MATTLGARQRALRGAPAARDGQAAYAWDDNGNLLSDGTSGCAYDAAHRLTQVTPWAVSYA